MRIFRAIALLSCAVLLALLASACGGGSSPSSGGATIAPESTSVFVTVTTDPGSDQWQAAAALLEQFPGGSGLIEGVLQDIEEDDLDFETDVDPALGPETDFVVMGLSDEPTFVVLTQPDDSAKFQTLVESGDEPGVSEELDDGWWAAARSQEILDQFDAAREDGDSLADSDAYQEATGKLPEDTLATVYLDAAAVNEAAGSTQSGAVPLDQQALAKCLNAGQSSENQALAFALLAEEGGLRLNGVGTGAIPAGDAGDANLDEFFPGDALAFVDAQGFGDAFQKSLDCITDSTPELSQSLAQIQLVLGTSLEELLGTLFGGELGVAVYGPGTLGTEGGLNPVVIVATEVEDEGDALGTITGLFDKAALFTGGELALGDASVDGMEAKLVMYEGKAVAYFGTLDGKLVVSTTEAALSALAAGGSTLAEDDAYTSAQEASGVPDDTASLVYVNLQDAVGLVSGALASAEAAPEVLANVEPLKSLLLWSEGPEDDTATFEAFLQID